VAALVIGQNQLLLLLLLLLPLHFSRSCSSRSPQFQGAERTTFGRPIRPASQPGERASERGQLATPEIGSCAANFRLLAPKTVHLLSFGRKRPCL